MKAVDLAKTQPHGAILPIPFLQRVLRKTEGDIDLAHLDAVLARVADDLGRRVKPHRLRVEQPAAEGIGVIVLQPGRDIDELGEARGMALRKAVGAKALDLLKTVLDRKSVV